MATNNQLRSWVRLDASFRTVPGSNVLRKNKPKTGRWLEITVDECCFPSVALSTTPADVTLATITFTLICDATTVATATITPATATTDVQDVVNALNDQLDFYGNFSASGANIDLALKLDIAQSLCGDTSTLSFTIS